LVGEFEEGVDAADDFMLFFEGWSRNSYIIQYSYIDVRLCRCRCELCKVVAGGPDKVLNVFWNVPWPLLVRRSSD